MNQVLGVPTRRKVVGIIADRRAASKQLAHPTPLIWGDLNSRQARDPSSIIGRLSRQSNRCSEVTRIDPKAGVNKNRAARTRPPARAFWTKLRQSHCFRAGADRYRFGRLKLQERGNNLA